MNKGENMKKMLKIVALLSVMIGNFAIFQSSAHAITSGYWQSTPSFNGGYTHRYHYSPYELLQKHSLR